MDFNIREARETDLELVRKHTVETAWTDFSDSERKELQKDKEKWARHLLEGFERLSKRENHKIFVAEDENQTFLGYLWVGESVNMMTGLKSGFVYDLFVKEEFRGRGIGKILMEKAESYCRERGYSRLLLMVAVKNETAIRLYDSMGFKPEQTYMAKELN